MTSPLREKWRGNCYEAALNALADRRGDATAVLVHGYPLGTGALEGVKHGHAWIEVLIFGIPFVIDYTSGSRQPIPRDAYHRLGRISANECFVYTRDEAQEWLDRTDHCGPWEGPDAVPPLSRGGGRR